jgi:hypothetical protein
MAKIVNDIVHLNDAFTKMDIMETKDMPENEFFGDIRLRFRKGMITQIIKEESVTLTDN